MYYHCVLYVVVPCVFGAIFDVFVMLLIVLLICVFCCGYDVVLVTSINALSFVVLFIHGKIRVRTTTPHTSTPSHPPPHSVHS